MTEQRPQDNVIIKDLVEIDKMPIFLNKECHYYFICLHCYTLSQCRHFFRGKILKITTLTPVLANYTVYAPVPVAEVLEREVLDVLDQVLVARVNGELGSIR
jgi:hypothetical protein